jgi:hypothetical protein
MNSEKTSMHFLGEDGLCLLPYVSSKLVRWRFRAREGSRWPPKSATGPTVYEAAQWSFSMCYLRDGDV